MIKNIIFDIGGVLAEPKSGHWFITTNFWNISFIKTTMRYIKNKPKKILILTNSRA